LLTGILHWLKLKTGVAQKVQRAGVPSFEPLEPRVLLSADLAGVQPVLACDAVPADHAIYVDLNDQGPEKQREFSPVLTFDALPGDETSQPQTEREIPSSPELEQARPYVTGEVLSGDSHAALPEDAAESAVLIQHDDRPTPADALPIAAPGPPAGTQGQPAVELFGVSPALFVENQGQWSDPTIRYVHDGEGVDVAVTDMGVVFRATDTDLQMLQFSASFGGANAVRPVGLERSASLFNYYVGDPAGWRQDVPSYEAVAYEELYEGIDLRVQGLLSHVKYEFHVAPGEDYRRIAVRYEGIEGLLLGEDGSLQVNLGAGRGVIRDDAPYLYQEIDGQKVEVAGRFILLDDRTYSFEISGAIDPDHALVIDPDLAWSTYLGSGGDDYGLGIAVGASGGVYVTGVTQSSGWASGGFDPTYNGGQDAFVVKLSSSGEHVWSTYLGGSSSDSGDGIAVDASGSVYVTGTSDSSGWTSGGFDPTYNGGGDAFVAKLSASGEHLWSTYLGGGDDDQGGGITVDTSGAIYVTGATRSSGWTSGGFDTTYGGGRDAFVVKLSSNGQHLWSTYWDGADQDWGHGIAVDGSDGVYVTGTTTSPLNGIDAFVLKLNSSGEHLWSTSLGGSDWDEGEGVAVDTSGSVYVTGETCSSGWTSDGFDTTFNGGVDDAFVAKFADTTPPTISSFSVSPTSVTLGGSFMITYTVCDSGGSGLNSVQLWRTDNLGAWPSQPVAQNSASGDGPVSGALSDVPPSVGDWWYGIHVFDTAGNSITETQAGGQPIHVVVNPPDTTPPSPDPSTWAAAPYATGTTSVFMVATMAADVSGVEYYFHETSGNPGATDSGWQDSNVHEDTGLSTGTVYTYVVRTRDRSINHNEGADSAPASVTTPSPVYRFWSSSLQRHFYTVSESEKNKLINNYSDVWTYEKVAYFAFAGATDPIAAPIYRFWSPMLKAHFYTMREAERDKLINNYPNVWTYERVAFYTYAVDAHPLGTNAVYRFWSGSAHFYTMNATERDKLINDYSRVWAYELIAWYAYPA